MARLDDNQMQQMAEQLVRLFGGQGTKVVDNIFRDLVALHAMRVQIEDEGEEGDPVAMARAAFDCGDAFAAERALRRATRQDEGMTRQ